MAKIVAKKILIKKFFFDIVFFIFFLEIPMRKKLAAAHLLFTSKNNVQEKTEQLEEQPTERVDTPKTELEEETIHNNIGVETMDSDKNNLGDLGGFEPDVINYDEKEGVKTSQSGEENKVGLVQKFKNLPLWGKGAVAIVVVSIFMIVQDYRKQSSKPLPAAEVEITAEMNTSKAPEVETKPVAEQTPEQVKMEKLNSCLIASPLTFKFGQEGVIPMVGEQQVSNETPFCEEFTLKNYHLDGANNSLSIVGDIYSGTNLVKHISVDPLAYFKPTYYLEGISIRHPKTQAEVQYMPGDFILKSPSASLQLTGVLDKGATVEYSLMFNGQKTAISVDRKYVQ
ncbi:MAG: hypothetical protein PHT07_10655 [Paludibacter sp.]|nr:hypothetical protein [Paludibacter sp.]